jgi:thiol-disulfide isomerase/thioredoxin
MMRAIVMAVALLVLTAGVGSAAAPEKAVCRACEVRGAGHGEEKVAASREFEGRDYHFCSKDCAEAFDAFPDGYAVHPLPRPAPAIVVTTTEDESVSLGSTGGDVILLDFWATWCAPCKKAMPELEELQQEYGDSGLRVLGVSIDEKADLVEKFLKKRPLGYAVAIDSAEEPAWHEFAVAAIPAVFLIDRQGQIVGEWKGSVEMSEVRRQVASLLAVASE